MKKKLKAFLVVLLTLSMVLTCLTTSSLGVFADEDEGEGYGDMPDYEEDGEPVYTEEPGGEGEPGGEEETPMVGTPSFAIDKNNVSMGTIVRGSESAGTVVVVTNNSTYSVNLIYAPFSTTEDSLRITPAKTHLEPLESTKITLSPNSSLPAGTVVSGTFKVTANSDSEYYYAALCNYSYSIVEQAQPKITSVSVVPGSATATKGKTYNFSAEVKGENNYSKNVAWSVEGNTSSGTFISTNGQLTVAGDEGASQFVVRATSQQDPSMSGTAGVSLQAGQRTVTVMANPAGSGDVTGGGIVSEGGSTTVSCAPRGGYIFLGWTIDGQTVSTTPSYTLNNVRKDTTVVANFKQNVCSVITKKNIDNAGSVTNSANVGYGSTMTIEAKAYDGFRFVCWQENGKNIATSPAIQISNITFNREFVAVFERIKYKVNLSYTPQDTGNVSGGGEFDIKSNPKIVAKAYQGYSFEGWYENNKLVSKNAEYVIEKINRDYNLVAVFSKDSAKKYVITASNSNAGGTISPLGDTTVDENGKISYSIVPESGYVISKVLVDGKNVGAVNTYTFNKISGNHTIAVTYAQKQVKPAENKNNNTSKKEAEKKEAEKKEAEKKEAAKKEAEKKAAEEVKEPEVIEETDVDEIPVEEIVDPEPVIIDEEDDLDSVGGTLARMDITINTAKSLIRSGQGYILLKEAVNEDNFDVTISNDLGFASQESLGYGNTINTSVPNFEEVIESLLSEDEMIDILNGGEASINLSIYGDKGMITDSNKSKIKAFDSQGRKVGDFFEILFMKTIDGNTEMVTKTGVPVTIVIRVPDALKESGEDFVILRDHEGVVTELQDMDSDPNTITFQSDEFSTFAIAYKQKSVLNGDMVNILAIVVIALALVLTIVAVGRMSARKKARR